MASAIGGLRSGVGAGCNVLGWARSDARVCAYYLELDCELKGHQGCVNTIQWHEDGKTLLTSGDDTDIRVWTPAGPGYKSVSIDTEHTGNVFDVRSVDRELTNLVSCAADGQVLCTSFTAASGAGRISKQLFQHEGRAHKLAVRGAGSAGEGYTFLSAGEDGIVALHDLREAGPRTGAGSSEVSWRSTKLLRTQLESFNWRQEIEETKIGINIVCFDPQNYHQFLVGGDDCMLRVYDLRNCNATAQLYCPSHMSGQVVGVDSDKFHITGACYSRDGSTIAATYNDEHIYLFHAVADCGPFMQEFQRLDNVRTIYGLQEREDSSDEEEGADKEEGDAAGKPAAAEAAAVDEAGTGPPQDDDKNSVDSDDYMRPDRLPPQIGWDSKPYGGTENYVGDRLKQWTKKRTEIDLYYTETGRTDPLSSGEAWSSMKRRDTPELVRKYLFSSRHDIHPRYYMIYEPGAHEDCEQVLLGAGKRSEGIDVEGDGADTPGGSISTSLPLRMESHMRWRAGAGGPRWGSGPGSLRVGAKGTRRSGGAAHGRRHYGAPSDLSGSSGSGVRGWLGARFSNKAMEMFASRPAPLIPRQALGLPRKGTATYEQAARFKRFAPDRTYTLQLRGYRNADTVKGVTFMGKRSEVVVAGSDSGHIIAWDRYTGNHLCTVKADKDGAVNCLHGHPAGLPILATSGLEHTAKVWSPSIRRTLSESKDSLQTGASKGTYKGGHAGAGTTGQTERSSGAAAASVRRPAGPLLSESVGGRQGLQPPRVADPRASQGEDGYFRLSRDQAVELLERIDRNRETGMASRPARAGSMAADRIGQVQALMRVSLSMEAARYRVQRARRELGLRMSARGWQGRVPAAPRYRDPAMVLLMGGRDSSDEEDGSDSDYDEDNGGDGPFTPAGVGGGAPASGGALTGESPSQADASIASSSAAASARSTSAATGGSAGPEYTQEPFTIEAARAVLGAEGLRAIADLEAQTGVLARLRDLRQTVYLGLLHAAEDEDEDEDDEDGEEGAAQWDSSDGSDSSSESGSERSDSEESRADERH